MLECGNINEGSVVLDIATGLGDPCLRAAQKVGKSGRLVATDNSQKMLDFAKEKAAELGVQDIIEFKQADAETLEFENGDKFDCVLCRCGLMFIADPDAFLKKVNSELLKPGAPFVALVWSYRENNPMLSLSMDVADEVLQHPRPNGVPTFSFADQDVFRRRLEAAGFERIRFEVHPMVFELKDEEEFAEFKRDTSPTLRAQLAAADPDKERQYWEALKTAVAKYKVVDDGETGRTKILAPAESVIVVAFKPITNATTIK
eukprot:GEZU01014643.1.p1 GENE.GEZU01014643.1~~GEZU01014643.1.p1  ORF type:complete len:293 (-),score=68.99 GEZU01014643.1:19-798(-)